MPYEVELKFPLADPSALESRLAELGACTAREEVHRDVYFTHPVRSFPETDEALRMRYVGQACRVTYKGPKVDTASKTRIEVEAHLADDAVSAEAMREIFERLGFRPVAEVHKRRRERRLEYRGYDTIVTIDDVEQVGLFSELETSAEEPDVPAARDVLQDLAQHLGLTGSIRTSYLELLLEKRSRVP